MKNRFRTIACVLLTIFAAGCSSPLYFSRPGAAQGVFKTDCLEAESGIRQRRIAESKATYRSLTDGQSKGGGIQGSALRTVAHLASIGDVTKSFDEEEAKEFVGNMKKMGWEYHPEKPNGVPIFSKNKKLE